MNPRDFYILALKLSKSNQPVECRTAINRAYYAAYHVGIEILEDLECGIKISKNAGGHGEVIKFLSNSGDKLTENAATQLNGLLSNRIKSDYRLDYSGVENKETADANVKVALGIIEILEDWSNDDAKRNQIAKALIEYQERIRA